jgi:NAD(P)-dependent dehydrogenase (short-subunit alcohol dehydrogenase family)
MGLLDGKAGLVTGAARGLGRATAVLASREGSQVTVADVNREGGEEAVEEIRRLGGNAIFVRTDVSQAEQVEEMVARTLEAFGRLDWASNNAAGGARTFGPLHEIDENIWSRTLDICLKGVFYGMKFEIPAMLETGGGSIVNITSASIFKGEAMLAAYVAAKGGVDALTKTGAAEYAARGIRVNSVAPGGFETRALERYLDAYPEIGERVIGSHAMRRVGRAEEVAEPVVWLASQRSSFVTGSCLLCDGGALVNSHML